MAGQHWPCYLTARPENQQKNNRDQTPLSIIGKLFSAFWNPSEHHSTIVLRGSRGAGKKGPIMPRGGSV